MKLSKVQWIGVALSILWAAGAGIYTHNADVERADNFVKFAFRVCSYNQLVNNDASLEKCDREKVEHLATFMEGSSSNIAVAALAPIPFGWLAAFILVYVWRIQVAGFRACVPWSAMNVRGRTFATICGLTLGVVLLFGLLTLMNLYADTKVPVSLALKARVIKTGTDLVTAEGTWTRSGMSKDSSMAYPLQTSTIQCNRVERRCVESRASVAGNTLVSEVVDYELQTWTDKSISLRNESPCAEELYTIDLVTSMVSGAGRRINKDSSFCKTMAGEEEEWSYRLSDGFPVYWELRKQSRPTLLRVLQTGFGN